MKLKDILKQQSFDEFSATFSESEERVCRRIMMMMMEESVSMSQAQAICAATIRGMRGGDDDESVERSASVNKNTLSDKMQRFRMAVEEQLDDHYYVDSDDDYVMARSYITGQTYRYGYTFEGNEFIIDIPSGQRIAFETFSIPLGEEATELSVVERSSLSGKVSKFLSKYFGGSEDNSHLAVIKQFQEEEMIAVEPLYCLADEADAHKEGMTQETIRKMVDNFNTNIDNISGNISHVAMTDGFAPIKAWINECECMIGDEYVPEGQPIVKVKFFNEVLWEARKAGELGGVSIGAKGKRTKNPDFQGEQ